jgi:hypothetical protein
MPTQQKRITCMIELTPRRGVTTAHLEDRRLLTPRLSDLGEVVQVVAMESGNPIRALKPRKRLKSKRKRKGVTPWSTGHDAFFL